MSPKFARFEFENKNHPGSGLSYDSYKKIGVFLSANTHIYFGSVLTFVSSQTLVFLVCVNICSTTSDIRKQTRLIPTLRKPFGAVQDVREISGVRAGVRSSEIS